MGRLLLAAWPVYCPTPPRMHCFNPASQAAISNEPIPPYPQREHTRTFTLGFIAIVFFWTVFLHISIFTELCWAGFCALGVAVASGTVMLREAGAGRCFSITGRWQANNTTQHTAGSPDLRIKHKR